MAIYKMFGYKSGRKREKVAVRRMEASGVYENIRFRWKNSERGDAGQDQFRGWGIDTRECKVLRTWEKL